MKLILNIAVLFCILSFAQGINAQNKKRKLNKGTSKREIRKRQEKAFEQDKDMNAFNPMQPMGARQNDARDDILWHSESANTVYPKAGNISLISPSRYGIKPGLEVSSNVFMNYWVPNLTLKKRWANNNWYVATKHGLYSATPGINFAQKNNFTSIVDSAVQIPFVLSVKNELIVSKYISSDNRCSNDQPFVILSAGIGVDVGISFGESGLTEMREHFLTNRSPSLTGKGAIGYAKVRADWEISNMLMLGGQLKYFRGNFTGNQAFEQSTELQTFITPTLSFNIGYILSIANYNTPNKLSVLPLIDINWYFGKKQSRQKGLWGTKMF
nr:hypothetical protein [uncultured Carboxylicivirga sp.]